MMRTVRLDWATLARARVLASMLRDIGGSGKTKCSRFKQAASFLVPRFRNPTVACVCVCVLLVSDKE